MRTLVLVAVSTCARLAPGTSVPSLSTTPKAAALMFSGVRSTCWSMYSTVKSLWRGLALSRSGPVVWPGRCASEEPISGALEK